MAGRLKPPGTEFSHARSRENIFDDRAGNIGQAEVAPLETVDQLRMLDSEQGEHRGVKVMDMHRVLDRRIAEFIYHKRAKPPHITLCGLSGCEQWLGCRHKGGNGYPE